jgi:hypothetical protein
VGGGMNFEKKKGVIFNIAKNNNIFFHFLAPLSLALI